AMSALTDEINAFLSAETGQAAMSVEEAALGFVRVANESMCRPIRALTQAKGHNTAKHALACFGGAGGQHACAIARSLGMTRVFVHKYSGILSAFGLALADVVHEAQEPCALEYRQDNLASIEKRFQHLEGECLAKLTQQGFDKKQEIFVMLKKNHHHGNDDKLAHASSTGSNRRQRYFNKTGTNSNSNSCGSGIVATVEQPTHVPASIRCPPMLSPFGCQAEVCGGNDNNFEALFSQREELFNWLDKQANNNSGESSSRKVASKETSRREVENWYYMHFRFRMQGYQSLIYAIRQSAREDSVFSEDHLDKWTFKMRFRIRKSSPLKTALVACASRLGLESDPDVIFCIDGFYGDALSGRVHNRNEVPNRVVVATSTCRALGLGNGSCLFVSRASRNERDNANMQVQLDLLRGFVVDDGDELGYEHDDEGIFGRVFATTRESKGSRSSSSESLNFQTEGMANFPVNVSCVRYERYLHLRYDGTDCAVMCRGSTEPNEDYLSVFVHRYRTEFGFTLDDRRVLIDDIRVRGVASSGADAEAAADSLAGGEVAVEVQQPEPVAHSRVYFEGVGWQTVGIYRLDRLSPGQCITGPAVVLEQNSTVLVEPDWTASLTKTADLLISRKSAEAAASVNETAVAESEVKVDSIQLSIFSHRFMSIAEQMGRVLQRTSISTNIKERLDFSCALFGPDGGLVANAPHIPVHLGAMQETVRYQMANCELLPGDVILANHPRAGGSHLPDLTVITPVFLPGSGQSPIFFVANRGHHADIGGRTPGSMPPDSHSILEEGAVFRSFHLVRGGQFREAEVTKELMAPAQLPGCSGTRNLHDNLSDLRAQVAANQKGVALVTALIEEYSLGFVQAYMKFIQANAETAVRDLLRRVGASALARTGASRLSFADSLDDGSDIRLSVDIDAKAGSAVFDFAGTSLESHGNLNAPRAVTMSALIYCLRCMVPYSIPLNQGCLAPIQLRLPEGSLLSPSDIAAVVGGNVLTSQRIVDVILGAFSACAASQGCMNNVTFGDDSVGYYETVAGGSGAGPSWHGRSGVHTHMTNTRITDVEILERRYPVIVDHFSLCPGTGGQGQFNGGDGILRVLRFRKDLTLSVLTERRVHAPYGLKGGQPGSRGSNSLEVAATGRRMNLGAKTSVSVGPGDRFVLRTPGGGGFGPLASKGTSDSGAGAHQPPLVLRGTLVDYEQMQFSA
uniref:Hydantoinase_A domain-containing protein n=1 Tax=Macrostomum lignano TaxID=282301 RepID=A0A1I8GUT3_9PLAT